MAAEEAPKDTPLAGTPPPPSAGKESDVRSSQCLSLETWQIHPIPLKPYKPQIGSLMSREAPELKFTPSKKSRHLVHNDLKVVVLHQNDILWRSEIPGVSTFDYRAKATKLQKEVNKDENDKFSDEFKEW